jgi:hypothetical protein
VVFRFKGLGLMELWVSLGFFLWAGLVVFV